VTSRSPITPATVALDPVEEGVQRRRSRLRPLREAVAAGGVIVGSHFDRMRRPGLHEADFDPPPPEWAVGQNGGYRGSAWRFRLAHQMAHRRARPQCTSHRDRARHLGGATSPLQDADRERSSRRPDQTIDDRSSVRRRPARRSRRRRSPRLRAVRGLAEHEARGSTARSQPDRSPAGSRSAVRSEEHLLGQVRRSCRGDGADGGSRT
jgi:hypothetical protein